MLWVIVSSVLVAAIFVGTFALTGNTWDATNAAGIASLIQLLIYLYRSTRPPVSVKARWWTFGISGVVIIGTILYWSIMYRMTHWQYNTLHTIHKVIFHGSAMDALKIKGLKVLSDFAEQDPPKANNIGEVFRKVAEMKDGASSLVDVGADSSLKIYAAAVSDSEIVLIAQSFIPIDGENPYFINFDGRVGMIQDKLSITKKGLVYEIQN